MTQGSGRRGGSGGMTEARSRDGSKKGKLYNPYKGADRGGDGRTGYKTVEKGAMGKNKTNIK